MIYSWIIINGSQLCKISDQPTCINSAWLEISTLNVCSLKKISWYMAYDVIHCIIIKNAVDIVTAPFAAFLVKQLYSGISEEWRLTVKHYRELQLKALKNSVKSAQQTGKNCRSILYIARPLASKSKWWDHIQHQVIWLTACSSFTFSLSFNCSTSEMFILRPVHL